MLGVVHPTEDGCCIEISSEDQERRAILYFEAPTFYIKIFDTIDGESYEYGNKYQFSQLRFILEWLVTG